MNFGRSLKEALMWVRDQVLMKVIVPAVVRCLTGKKKDLHKLLALERIPYPSPVFRAFLKRLRRDMDDSSGIAGLLLRLGEQSNPQYKHKLIENLAVNWVVKGAPRRISLRKQGYWVPFFIAISPTMRCNLNCTGCYAGLYSKHGELGEEELDDIFTQCKEMGNHFVVLSGGEPYLLREVLLRLFRKHRDIFFLTFTNGTRFDEPLVKSLAELGNVAPAVSVEGYRDETDARRGNGVHDQAIAAMKLLNRYGVIFGISVTYTSENVDLVTTDRFIEYYMEQGVVFAWYFMFMPVGRDPILALVPTPEQRIRCGKRVTDLRKRYPVFMADFWNDGPVVGGCLGGARRYLHILNSGRVEPCVFAHFGCDNIRQKSLLEAANSPFFKAIRREFPYNENGNLKRPCILLDNPQVLRRLVARYLVPHGHEHSEDLIRDPAVVLWVDAYAERLKEITEPEWQHIICDPTNRWFKDRTEYKNLFQFKQTDVPLNDVRTFTK
ncbi:MAG: radical SAM protein [Acidobacteriia bacterium]|nr:radical SAM protein [Terriglobia bacterium]